MCMRTMLDLSCVLACQFGGTCVNKTSCHRHRRLPPPWVSTLARTRQIEGRNTESSSAIITSFSDLRNSNSKRAKREKDNRHMVFLRPMVWWRRQQSDKLWEPRSSFNWKNSSLLAKNHRILKRLCCSLRFPYWDSITNTLLSKRRFLPRRKRKEKGFLIPPPGLEPGTSRYPSRRSLTS